MRSSVIDMEATMASYFLAISAGMMPSQSCCTSLHSAFMALHSAQAMSMSKSTSLPSGVTELNGG